MRIVVAVGGNALLRRQQSATAENQLANVRTAATQLARVAQDHELLVVHGNGPQVGLLALQATAYTDVPAYPLDMLGAESDGLIGYLLEQELSNQLQGSRSIATLLTRVEVDAEDPAFDAPTKPIGPVYGAEEAERWRRERGWVVVRDGVSGAGVPQWRRVVPSPEPRSLVDERPIRWLLERGAVVICGGGGGIPVLCRLAGLVPRWLGVEAVIDKDATAGLIAQCLDADRFVIATDVAAVYTDFGNAAQKALESVSTADLQREHFAAGSMHPKVVAACRFVETTGRPAVIGSLEQIADLVLGQAGTRILPV